MSANIRTMKYFSLLFLLFLCTGVRAQKKTDAGDQPAELGRVSWLRDYDAALAESRNTGKPVLILFQEVPGCATCRNYGRNTLSHPLIVEAIENEFVPLAIFNNKQGDDARVLAKYGEPSWNNPVVRIVDADGKNLGNRLAGNYSARGLYDAIGRVQLKTGRPVPGYLEALGRELTADTDAEEAFYQMYCFWSGEHHLGNHDGVLTTEPGFLNGHEVVKITYDPARTNTGELADYAAGKDFKPVKGGADYRPAKKDHYYQLKQTDFIYLPLTEVQKTKLNAAYGRGADMEAYLSPKQLKYYRRIKAGKTKKIRLYDLDFETAWNRMLTAK